VREHNIEDNAMAKDISKLPKWAQERIAKLELELKESRERESGLQALLVEHPIVNPDVLPPSEGVANGWIARRPVTSYEKPEARKACTSSISHSTRKWDAPDTQGKLPLYSSPALALKALIPSVVKAYRDELAQIISLIEKEENS
jgi:hypothetical protein